MSSSYALEGKAVEGMKKWWAENGKEVYGVGPLLPRTYWDTLPTDEGAIDVRDFLEGMLAKHGKRSVILVRLIDNLYYYNLIWGQGVFWELLLATGSGICRRTYHGPHRQEIPFRRSVRHSRDLIQLNLSKIFCHASPFAVIPPELSNVIKSSGLGILSSWVPQQYVLNHPVRLPIAQIAKAVHNICAGNRVVSYAWWARQCYRVTRQWYPLVSSVKKTVKPPAISRD